MRKRRRPLQYCSDDDDDDNAAPEAPKPAAPVSSRRHSAAADQADLEEGGDDNVLEEMRRNGGEARREETQTRRHRGPAEEEKERDGELEEKAETDEEEEDEDGQEAVPVGDPVEVTGKGKQYAAYQYDGNIYKLEDTAMFRPDEEDQKPYVGIIKEINEFDWGLSVTAQWFYRPEEAQKEGGDPRELLYSFHIDDVTPESVMHTCVVHFIPQHKQVPSKKEHPGFIVQEVYDHKEEKHYKVMDTDTHFEADIEQEIELLVMKTMNRIGQLPDRDPEDIPGDKSGNLPRRGLRKKPLKPKDVPRDAPAGRSEQLIKNTAGTDNLKNRAILSRYKALTGNQNRDYWRDKFVGTILALPHSRNDNEKSYAPNEVVSIVASLEQSTYEAMDLSKYKQKMRKLVFNIQNSSVLCKRLMNKELDPAVLLTMAPEELKAGLMPAEIGSEYEEPRQLQTTEARCKLCMEKNVGISDVIRGNRGDRYQLECNSCGHKWSASRDEVFV